MINNYVKHGMMPAPVKKKYSREHVAYLIIICSLKQALPISDIKELIERRVKRTSIEETLNYFNALKRIEIFFFLYAILDIIIHKE